MPPKVQLKGEFLWSNSRLKRGLAEAEGTTRASAKRMAKIAGGALAAIGGIGAMVSRSMKVAKRADEIHRFALSLDTTTDAIQRMEFAAAQSKTSIDSVFKGMAELSRKSADPTARQAQAMERLGLSAETLKNLEPDRQLEALAQAFEAAEDKNMAFNSVYELTGRAARDLLPLLRSGGKGISDLYERANGSLIDESDVKKFGDLFDDLDAANRKMDVMAANVTIMFVEMAEGVMAVWKPVDEFFEKLTISAAFVAGVITGDKNLMAGAQTTMDERFGPQSSGATSGPENLLDGDPASGSSATAGAVRYTDAEAARVASKDFGGLDELLALQSGGVGAESARNPIGLRADRFDAGGRMLNDPVFGRGEVNASGGLPEIRLADHMNKIEAEKSDAAAMAASLKNIEAAAGDATEFLTTEMTE